MTPPGYKAILTAAGIGTRLRPLTDVLPKCLMPINGRPLLGMWLDMLARSGAVETVVNLHHHAGLVREYLHRSPHAGMVMAVHEEQLLGTGGTLLRNRGRLGSGPVLFAHADNLSSFDPAEMFAAHRARPRDAAMTMMTFIAEDPRQCGIVELDPHDVVIGFHEKSPNPPGDLANAAVFILEPEVFDFMQALGKQVIEFSTDVIPHFLGRIVIFRNTTYHRDIGTLQSLLRAQLEYPLIARDWSLNSEGDPWFGLMKEDNGRLANEFVSALANGFRFKSIS